MEAVSIRGGVTLADRQTTCPVVNDVTLLANVRQYVNGPGFMRRAVIRTISVSGTNAQLNAMYAATCVLTMVDVTGRVLLSNYPLVDLIISQTGNINSGKTREFNLPAVDLQGSYILGLNTAVQLTPQTLFYLNFGYTLL